MVGICRLDQNPVGEAHLRHFRRAAAEPDRGLIEAPDGRLLVALALGGGLSAAAPGATGTMPLCSSQLPFVGSGTWAICDGRIDNRQDLRAILPDRELHRADCSDAAVVLAAYRKWGTDCPRHLIGDYSFILWDAPARHLFAARDPGKLRPFYYAWNEGRLMWASDPRLLFQLGDIGRDYDTVYLTTFIVLEELNWERTPYAEVKQLPGGWGLIAGADGMRVRRWWQLPEPHSLRYRDSRDYQAHLRDLLREAVRARLCSDRPVTIALSRGIDSARLPLLLRPFWKPGKPPARRYKRSL